MSSEGTLATVKEIMIDTFDVDDLELTRQTTAEDVEEWDSLSHIRLMVAVERSFKVRFTNAEIESMGNVGDLVDLIGAKVGAG
jgi:acyl carrier protein